MPAPAFDALVAAYEPGQGPGGLRALMPLAGRALVEHQLRRARAAGAEQLLLLFDELPLELAEIVTALRHDGMRVLPCAGLDVAADALSPDRRLLVIADACLPDERTLRDLAHQRAPCLATVADGPGRDRYERIDGTTRWAGLALLDGARVRDAAAMLGSWDAVSTLLRRAVQEDAARLAADDELPTLLLHPAEVQAAEASLVRAARPRPRSWAERWTTIPLLDLAMPRLVARGVPAAALAWPGALLALLAGLLSIAGWRWPALAALILCFPLVAGGGQLGRIADDPLPFARIIRFVVPTGAALAALGLAWQIARGSGQWGWWLVAATVLGGTALAERLEMVAGARPPRWLPRIDALAWTMLPFAVIGRWDVGLAAVALHVSAGAGFFVRALARRAAADAGLPAPKLF